MRVYKIEICFGIFFVQSDVCVCVVFYSLVLLYWVVFGELGNLKSSQASGKEGLGVELEGLGSFGSFWAGLVKPG